MPPQVLDRRSLNRATLARQLLLARSGLGVAEAVEHLVGLQVDVSAEAAALLEFLAAGAEHETREAGRGWQALLSASSARRPA
ncbi:hypothetical protein [Dactylosporangium sp. CA-092794]|uniref:hypothetical protein n=1 Tax=Dactylosporangium sp. CA-092794 TaxID=3239929 RepID=UPI003D90E0BD